jgi:hypothetical protein
VYGNGYATKKFDDKFPTGENGVGYIEIWNEHDKHWFNDRFTGGSNMVQFAPEEYAAMLSAAYDGQNGTVKASKNGLEYAVGSNSSDGDPDIGFVVSGLSDFSELAIPGLPYNYWTYLLKTKEQFDILQGNGTSFNKAVKAINYHHYSDNVWNNTTSTGGVSPEEDISNGVSFKQRLSKIRIDVDAIFTDNGELPKELWLSELGYDTNKKSAQRSPEIATNQDEAADQQETQGRYIVRSLLEVAFAGWDRGMVFDLRDGNSSESGGLFDGSGLLKDANTGYQPKKSFYYVSTMKQALAGKKFRKELTDNGYENNFEDPKHPRVYYFTDESQTCTNGVLAVWLPTHENYIYNGGIGDYTIDLSGLNCGKGSATLIKMVIGDENGQKYRVDATFDKITIPASFITERPIFIQLGVDEADPLLTCIQPEVRGKSCNAVSVSWKTNINDVFDHYLVYYYEKLDSEEDPSNSGYIPSPIFNINDPHWKLFSDEVDATSSSMNIIIPGLQHLSDTYFVLVIGVTNEGVITPFEKCLGMGMTAGCDGMISPKSIIMREGNNPSQVITDCLTQLVDNTAIDNCYKADKPINGQWDEYGYSIGSITCGHTTESIIFEILSPLIAQTMGLYDASNAGPVQIEYSLDGSTFLPIQKKETPNNPYFSWYSYETFGYAKWRYFSLPNDPNSLINSPKYIRITKLKFSVYDINQQPTLATARIGKVVFYGYPEGKHLDDAAVCCASEKAKLIKGVTTVKDELTNLNLEANFTTMPQEIIIDGTLKVDVLNYGFWQSSKVFMMPGSNIIVGKGNLFNVNSSSIVGCDKMWKGIEVEYGGKIWYEKSILRDAENAFYLNRSISVPTLSTLTDYRIRNSSLEANLYNITIPYGTYINDFNNTSFIVNNDFDGTDNNLKKPYPGQQDWDTKTNYGVKASNVASMRIIGVGGFNKFRRMDYGLHLNSIGSVLFNATVFTDIQERLKQDYIIDNDGVLNPPYITGGIGVTTRNNTNITFIGTGKLNLANPTFNRVTTAFDMQFSIFSISSTRMENVTFGIKNIACRDGENKIYNNYIAHLKGGILSGFNNRNGIKIYQNTIVTGDNMTAFGISGSGFTNATDPQVFEIYNNEIRVRNERSLIPTLGAGIYLNNTKNANLYNNNIRVHNYDLVTTGANEKPKIHGIYLSNSPDNTVCSNNIFGSPFPRGDSEGAGRGISLTNSTGNVLSCNVVDSLRIGIDIQMNCDAPNKMQGNTVLNNYFGLHVGVANTNAFTGTQSYKGNKWVNNGNYGTAAKNNSSISTLFLNRFTVNQSNTPSSYVYLLSSGSSVAGTILPLTYSPPSIFPDPSISSNLWFDFQSGETNYNCGESSNLSCNNNHLPPIKLKEKGIQQGVALGDYNLDNFQKAYAFAIKRAVFSDIKERFVNEPVSNEFNGFYQQQLGSAVEKAWITDDLIAKIGNNNSNLLSKIHRLDSFLVKSSELTADAEVFYTQDLEIQQTTIPPAMITPLAIEWQNERDLLYSELATTITADIVAASEANNKLIEPDEYIQLERWTNDIYLKYFVIPELVSEEVKQKIQDISDLCPQDAGLGVFKARSMYVVLTGSPRPEWETCFDTEDERISEERDTEKTVEISSNKLDFLLYSNPTDNTLSIKMLNESNEVVLFDIYNTTGTMIQSGRINDGFSQILVDKFSSGIYYFSINKDGVNTVKRFTILK